MSTLFEDVSTIIIKEYQEMQYSKKRMILLIVAVLMPLVFFIDPSNSLFSMDMLLILIPLMVSVTISSQLALYTILEEKSNKTLEVLLSLRISKLSIILGKTAISTIFGFILSIISFTFMWFILTYVKVIYFNFTFAFLIMSLLICHISSNIAILSTLLFTDIKIVPTISTIFMFLFLILISALLSILKLNYISIFTILIIFSIIVVYANVYILSNKVSLITK